jgi:hypothetical protein
MRSALAAASLLCLVAGLNFGHAADIDPTQLTLVERFIAAISAHDVERLKKLYHPASLACITAENRDVFDFVFVKDLSYAEDLKGGYSVTGFEAIDAATAAANEMGGMFSNPVPPTHQFQIDTSTDSGNRSLTLIRMAAAHDGAWFIVLGCPTAQGLAYFRERRAEGERQRAHAADLAGKLPDPLASEIRSLLAQERRVDAIKRYQSATGVDITIAVQVIDALGKR